MASFSSQEGLTKSRELGRYVDGSLDGKPQRGGRTVSTEEFELARKCARCDKQINKPKIPLVCPCKEAIYCSQDCLMSHSHNCNEEEEDDDHDKIVSKCYYRYQLDEEFNLGPSSDQIEKLMARTLGDQEHLLVLAEAGDPIAAYVVGVAYAIRRTDGKVFKMPSKYLDRSFSETTEIGIKWLKISAEAGVPEGMFLLSIKLDEESGLIDRRLAHQWLDKAYGTGKMDYLIELLESGGMWLPAEFENMSSSMAPGCSSIFSPTLSALLMAARWQEIRDWDGKTAMGEPFFSRVFFREVMEKMSNPVFISGRQGCCDIISKVVPRERNENNTKFLQGVKCAISADYELGSQRIKNGILTAIQGRTKYLVSCKHNGIILEQANLLKRPGLKAVNCGKEFPLDKLQVAGECQDCSRDALQRLKAVSNGLYSISINQVIPQYGFAARYVDEDGIIVQDIFKTYSKPDLRQVIQCLMSNPADLHPAAVAEDQNLYWTIVWYWGCVFHAVEDSCSRTTLEAVYGRLGGNLTLSRRADASALAAFPDSALAAFPASALAASPDSALAAFPASALAAFPSSAAGEFRIACGSEDCPRVDHDVKFNLCSGCQVRRYCNEECQKNDWIKHKQFCKAAKGGSYVYL